MMDEQVLAAMEKWPNVPAAYGWLSLNAQGLWRFHHQGDFDAAPSGDSIENQQLIEFFNRNYLTNDQGEWYIQNGPQKAFVNLPYAPLILFYDDAQQLLKTHHGANIKTIQHWYISEDGRVFAKTNIGPAMLIGRDMPAFIENVLISANNHQNLPNRTFNEKDFELLAQGQQLTLTLAKMTAPCCSMENNKAEETLGFVSYPKRPVI